MNKATPLIERFASGGPILKYAYDGISPGHDLEAPGPGLWTFSELAAHLLDTDLVFADRIKRVIAEEEPVLQAFEKNAWINRLKSKAMPVSEAVDLFAANRKWMARILRGCTEADFARTGNHTERGRWTLVEVLSYVTNHLDHHLRFLYAKRAAVGLAIPPRYTSEAAE